MTQQDMDKLEQILLDKLTQLGEAHCHVELILEALRIIGGKDAESSELIIAIRNGESADTILAIATKISKQEKIKKSTRVPN